MSTPTKPLAAPPSAEPKKLSGTRKYKLNQPHYRDGTMHPVGTIIEVDANEPKSAAWELVLKDTAGAVMLPPLPTPRAEVKASADAKIEASYA